MSDEKKIDKSVEEQISRISNNFESDVLRLIKTQSMIKSSGEVIDDEVEFLKSKIEAIQSKLDEISLRTSELHNMLQLAYDDKDFSTTHTGRYLSDYLNLVTSHNKDLKDLKGEFKERLSKGSERLDAINKHYIAELEAFQQEIDSSLGTFSERIKEDIESKLIDVQDKNGNDSLEPAKIPSHESSEKRQNGERTASQEQEVVDIHRKEREELEDEFIRYKRSFENQPRVSTKAKKEVVNESEYYEKMFSSSVPATHNQQQSGDYRKYILASILVVWFVAVLAFYMFFINKDGLDNFSVADSSTSIPIKNEGIKDIEIEVEAGGLEDKKVNIPIVNPPEVNTDVETPTKVEEPAEQQEPEGITDLETAVKEPEIEIPSEPVKEVIPKFDYEVIVGRANIRSGPSKKYGIVGTLNRGQKVESLNVSKGVWMKIKSEDGNEGWIGKRLLRKK